MRRVVALGVAAQLAACGHGRPDPVDVARPPPGEEPSAPPDAEAQLPYRGLFERGTSWRYEITETFTAECISDAGCDPLTYDDREADPDGVLRETQSVEAICTVDEVVEQTGVTLSRVGCTFAELDERDPYRGWTYVYDLLAQGWAMNADGLHELGPDADLADPRAHVLGTDTLVLARHPVVGTTRRTVTIARDDHAWCATRRDDGDPDPAAPELTRCFLDGSIVSARALRRWTNPEDVVDWPGVAVRDDVKLTLSH